MKLNNDSAAIVTGGASGLGAATAQALAAIGVSVHVFDLPAALDLAGAGDNIRHHAVDITSPEQVGAAMASVVAGGKALRVLVGCAGVGPTARVLGRSGVHSPTMFAKVVSVNLIGTFNVLSQAAEVMAQQTPDHQGQRGVIVNTASVAAYEGQVGQVAYAASKGGVVSMTLPAARDLASTGIRVNCIAPGIVDTPMLATVGDEVREGLAAGVPFPRRLAAPSEFADLVLMLVGHDYINGETVRMDGALRMAPR